MSKAKRSKAKNRKHQRRKKIVKARKENEMQELVDATFKPLDLLT